MYLLRWGECPTGLPFTDLNTASENAMRLMARWDHIRIDKATGVKWEAQEIIQPGFYNQVTWMTVFEWYKKDGPSSDGPSAVDVLNKANEE